MVELNLPPACRARTHQADNLAKLRREVLSLLELIAQILCAVVIARTSAVSSNKLSFVASTATSFEQCCITFVIHLH